MWGSDITVRYITASQVHCQAGPDLSAAQRHIVLANTTVCIMGAWFTAKKIGNFVAPFFFRDQLFRKKGKINQVVKSTLL